jgi:hypothetical protein|tara:strand:+ start:636 stop:824 length:189 start_codon:yes stop_codon:yes gene_type:complete
MYKMYFRKTKEKPHFIEETDDIEDFYIKRSMVMRAIGFHTNLVNNRLFVLNDGKKYGVYYAK